jgi:hypothetical protein
VADTKISALAAVSAVAAANEFAVNEAGTSKKATAAQLRTYILDESWIRQAAARTLANSGAEQKLFDSVTNGTLTLPTGVYFFECMFQITAMSATSGNLAFDILGAGTATLDDVLYSAFGADNSASATAAAQQGAMNILGQTAAAIVTAATGTAVYATLRGTFEITVAGTIIPSVTLLTAVATASVAAGSYFKCNRVGALNAVSVGAWS